MNNLLSSLDLQLVKSSLISRTDQEIAELIERPVEEVVALINELTGGAAAERTADVERARAEEQKAKAARRKTRRNNPLEVAAKQKRKTEERKKRNEVESQWHRQKESARKREARFSYKTKEVDLSKKISVKIDHKTTIFIDPEATRELTERKIKEAKATYSMLREKARNEFDLS